MIRLHRCQGQSDVDWIAVEPNKPAARGSNLDDLNQTDNRDFFLGAQIQGVPACRSF